MAPSDDASDASDAFDAATDAALDAALDFVQVAVLAAGMGTRLGRPFPKPLTPLDEGRSIHQQQVDNVRQVFGDAARIMVVVGFKHDLVMEANPSALFVYNEDYDQTNTSKSLLRALRASAPGGVVWMNGDVVFEPQVLARLAEQVRLDRSAVTVNTSAVGDEEVKYTVDDRGFVRELSKTVVDGLGESVGINYVSSRDKAVLVEHLERCAAQDYFERGIETAVEQDGLQVLPVDVSDLFVVEVDFDEDLARANAAR